MFDRTLRHTGKSISFMGLFPSGEISGCGDITCSYSESVISRFGDFPTVVL